MERKMGIEPTWLAWKARTLPLSYFRILKIIYNAKIKSKFLLLKYIKHTIM